MEEYSQKYLIWWERSKYEGQGFPSTIVIPSDPNALAERLELLLAKLQATLECETS